MSDADLELYREGIGAWSRGDRDFVLEHATEDFEFHAAQLFPGIQPVYRGREGLIDFWENFIADPWSELSIEIERSETLADGRILALLTFRGIGKGSGAEVTVPYAHIARIRDGMVERIDGYGDWEAALVAAGLASKETT